jgi:lipoprotein-anchoring transpeptidase ErfK/SrfK
VAAEIEAKDAAADDLRKKAQEAADARVSAKLPSDSGTGRRIVFSEGAQRVWLIDSAGKVQRTYLVSGSKFDNLQPGTYSVQSKTRNATAFDGSGTMEFFVRFATGYTAPIGFHTVPVDNAGRPEQTKSQLGTPQSAGCVRQWRDDAIALWNFAPIGTVVVVTT